MHQLLRSKTITVKETREVQKYYEDRVVTCDFCKKEIPFGKDYYIVDIDYEPEQEFCSECLKNIIITEINRQPVDTDVTVYRHTNYYSKNDYTDYINSQKEE